MRREGDCAPVVLDRVLLGGPLNFTFGRLQTHVTRFQLSCLALVATQAAHSIEEYVGHRYEVFPPARAVSGLISDDLERGFVIFNVAFCYF
jgi:hypothetical protein